MTTKRSVTSALALCALLAACGSGGGSSSGSGDEASKPPAQIAADAAAALKAAKSFHLSAKVNDSSSQSGGQFALEIDVVPPSSGTGTVTSAGVTAHFAYTAGKLYVQGKQFLASLSTAVADLVGDKWALLPATAASGFSAITDAGKLSSCLVQNHGTLSNGGTTSVNGQTAVVVVDAGDKPGTSPGKLYVAASGTAYPLKLESTASAGSSSSSSSSTSTDNSPTPSSGSADCSGTSGSAGDVATFSKFDAGVTVTPPPDAVDLSKLGG